MLRDEDGDATEIGRQRVFTGRIFDLDDVSIDFHGETLRRQWLVHPGSVAVLAIDERDQVVLLQQFRAPIGQRMWELPAGLRDAPGEPAVSAARRELAEETELQAAEWQKLTEFVPTGGSSDETVQVFLAEGLSHVATDFERTGEEAQLRVHRVSFDEVLAAVLAGDVRNGALMIGVLALAAKRR